MKNFLLLFFTLIITINAFAKSEITAPGDSIVLYASGLVNPMGIEIDSQGRLWVAEAGNGSNDGRVSIVTTDGIVHPFLTGLPSVISPEGEPSGTAHVKFDVDGKLLIVQGSGPDSLARSILVVDTSGFIPGNTPLSIADLEAAYNIGEFSVSQGAKIGNPFRIITGPDDDWFIVDSNLNGIIRRQRATGNLSVFSLWGNVVPTGIAYTGDKFYVGSLTAFPFPIGGAKIYEVDLTGNFSVYQENLTMIVDLDVDPLDNKLVCLQFAHFSGGFQSGTGALFKINNGTVDTLIFGFNLSAGMRFNSKGDLFVATYSDGEIYKIFAKPTGINYPQETVETFNLMQNYPNPFNPSTTISWQLAERSHTTLKIYDVLGKEIKTLVNEEQSEGIYEITFDGSGLSSGIYFYKINSISDNKEYSAVKKLIILK